MFLNPWMLIGVAGVGVPIVIHLLNQRKYQRVVWAAMRFVQLSLEKNRRRMQIEDLLLLFLRCALVALLAVALARPVTRSAAALLGRQPVTAVLLLDNSASMGKGDGVQTRFDLAKRAADETLAGLPRGSAAALLLVSDVVHDVIPAPTGDLALVRRKIAEASLCDRGTNVFVGLQRGYRTLAIDNTLGKVIYLITDGQALGWRQGGREGGAQEIFRLMDDNKAQVSTRVLLVGDHDTRNACVSGLRLATELPTVNKPLEFQVDVTNNGPNELLQFPVRLSVDDETTPLDQGIVDRLPPHSTRSISLHARLGSEGYHAITAGIPHDLLPADDERSMIIRVWRQVRVLLVDGEAGRSGREEDTFFVREALSAVLPDLRPSYFIQLQTISSGELEQTSLDLYDAIVLANVAELARPTIAALERLVGEGRGLIIFTGPHVNTEFYREVLYNQHGLLPAGLGEARGDAAQDEIFETLQTTPFTHPLARPLDEAARDNPLTAHFFRRHELVIKTPAATWPASDNPPGPTRVVISYADGTPAVVEHSFGQGRVVLFGSTANTQWNDLPVRAPLFVPLMQRVLDSVLHRPEEQLNLQVGQRLAVRCAGELWGNEARITRPARAERTTDTAQVDLVDNWPTLVYEDAEISGVYQAAISGSAQEPIRFAVQGDPAESNLQELSEAELAQLGRRATWMNWKPGSVTDAQAQEDKGTEFWRPVAVVVLLLCLMETCVAFWASKTK